MKIFISWSGNRSKAVAELFSEWLKCVIQASEPWISTRDIDRGATWYSEINDTLRDVSVGVIFLTMENKDNPWILFETGGLAKGLSSNRVCTFLIDLKPSDLHDPLAQFNHTIPTKDALWALIKTINASITEIPLPEKVLDKVFQTYWPQFEKGFAQSLSDNPIGEAIPPRSEEDILSEILNNTRTLTQKIRKLEEEVFIKNESIAKNLISESFESELMSNNDVSISSTETDSVLTRVVRRPDGRIIKTYIKPPRSKPGSKLGGEN
ncbi:TIR domain-containing protein [Phytobacter diazotrophicus]|nr:TIR domain-containing protein [Phytobacter diazotrophicus]